MELTKYNLSEETITAADKLEQWVYFLLHAHECDEAQLRRLLPAIEFQQAIATIAAIAARTEDRQMYDQREKIQRDYEWALSGAREEGLEKGREEGLEIGLERGRLAGRIQMLQELLGDPATSDDAFLGQSLDDLNRQLATLQQRLRDRPA